jgi:hypothetical protein
MVYVMQYLIGFIVFMCSLKLYIHGCFGIAVARRIGRMSRSLSTGFRSLDVASSCEFFVAKLLQFPLVGVFFSC